MVSIIIPVFNEEKSIAICLQSLLDETFRPFEIVVVDDGSNDKTRTIIENILSKVIKSQIPITLLTQQHKGPGHARNLGARQAKGDILVFLDADMTFARNFLEYLVAPIIDKKSKGTFTKEEYVSNWNMPLARCWNYREGIYENRKIKASYPHESPVFRAILTSEFKKVKGFDDIGFTDDWTLSRKLGYKATCAKGAICYHHNPETFSEVYQQARWIGKNEFISGNFIRRIVSLLRFSFFIKIPYALVISTLKHELTFVPFSFVYYWGIHVSIYRSFFGENKSK